MVNDFENEIREKIDGYLRNKEQDIESILVCLL